MMHGVTPCHVCVVLKGYHKIDVWKYKIINTHFIQGVSKFINQNTTVRIKFSKANYYVYITDYYVYYGEGCIYY